MGAVGWVRIAGACALALCLAGAALPAREPELPEAIAREPGLATRAALDRAARGDVEGGAGGLAAVARRHPEIADHAAVLEAQLWLDADRPAEALRAAGQGIQRAPRSPVLHELHRAMGEAQQQLGSELAARGAWEAALAVAPAAARSSLRFELARSLERDGRLEAAGERYLELWIERPTHPEADAAALRLDDIESELGRTLRGGREWRRRADRLFRMHRTERAFEAYELALAAGLPARERRRAERQRAHCLFRMRRYSEATAAFTALGRDTDARLWRARSLARSGRVEQSIRELEQLGRASGRTAVWARLLAALLLEDEGEPTRARALYASVAGAGSQRNFAVAALWRLGWTAYQEGRFAEAHERFSRLAANETDPIGRLRPLYWAARSLEVRDPVRARAELAELAREYPFSYYGWRAAGRGGAAAASANGAAALEPGAQGLRGRELARPRILLAAGLEERALAELGRLRGQARGLSDRLELARLYADAGDFHGAERLLVGAYSETLARGPARGFEELWWLAWPDAYAGLVRGSLPSDPALEPELVFAVMREESGYRPGAVSSAGALGLLQIMPATGVRLAEQVGLASFARDDLLVPDVNIRLGGFYLDRLIRRFDGNLSAAVASYNAGPEAVARWLGVASDDDVWVEAIPYSQTRAYVKRVLRSLHVYRVLY